LISVFGPWHYGKVVKQTLAVILIFCSVSWVQEAKAFDYVEHMFFTDRSCYEAQRRLVPLLDSESPPLAEYLALAIMCPGDWDMPYCEDDSKQVVGALNSNGPHEMGEVYHSMTLGDLAGFVDHVGSPGPVSGFPRARSEGMVSDVFDWLSEPPARVGATLGQVAEEACIMDEPIDWEMVETDIDLGLQSVEANGSIPVIDQDYFAWTSRLSLPQGPPEPAAFFTILNPHYLDLKLTDHAHFGEATYATWLGFHGAATTILSSTCEDTMGLDSDTLETISESAGFLDDLEWEDLLTADRNRRACDLLGELVRRRLTDWEATAVPELTAPVSEVIAQLSANSTDSSALLDQTVLAITSLVFEAAGLHYLQDSVAGGHLRTDRTARGLRETRFAHDTDGALGVVGAVTTPQGTSRLMAFGDSYMFGRALAPPQPCDWSQVNGSTREEVSACLLQRQRTILTGSGAASIIDWALGGRFYDVPEGPDPCDRPSSAESFACTFVFTAPPAAGGMARVGHHPTTITQASLPVPKEAFDYESLRVALSVDAAGDLTQVGARLGFFTRLGRFSHWMTSRDIGFHATLGEGTFDQFVLEFSYRFHYRVAARFVLDFGPMLYAGVRNFGDDLSAFAGVGPYVGLGILPEGWTKMPLDCGVSFRLPLTIADTNTGGPRDSFRVEAYWVEFALGLAFM